MINRSVKGAVPSEKHSTNSSQSLATTPVMVKGTAPPPTPPTAARQVSITQLEITWLVLSALKEIPPSWWPIPSPEGVPLSIILVLTNVQFEVTTKSPADICIPFPATFSKWQLVIFE